MTVVTFSVQAGSEGYSIARAVAAELGTRYYDWQISSEAAPPILNADANWGEFAERLMNRTSAGALLEEEMPSSVPQPTPTVLRQALRALSSEPCRQAVEGVVRRIAHGDVVIVGHGSQMVLRGRPDVFKVLVRAPFAERAARIAAEQGLSIGEASRTVWELDILRREFFDEAYDVDWLDSSLYDLTLSTAQISPYAAAGFIVDQVRPSSFKEGDSQDPTDTSLGNPVRRRSGQIEVIRTAA